jgi:hypothetical protein
MGNDLHDVSEVQSVLGARLNQLESGALAVSRTSNGGEDCTAELITDLKRVLAFVGNQSKWQSADKIGRDPGQSALGGPSYLKEPE